jgi:SAM-dependent methyltransferase
MSVGSRPTFYDEHPFDWFENYRGEERRKVLSPLLLQVIDAREPNSLVLDIGCGPGRVLEYLGFRGMRCIGLDRSANSIAMVVGRLHLPALVADNLRLPVQSGVADFVVSDGVVHHTPDPPKALAEICRVLKVGGTFYLAVYRPGGRYEFLYKYPGACIRILHRSAATRWILQITALPLYYLAHRLRRNDRVTWRGAANLFYDYFLSPQVEFISRQKIETLTGPHGLELVRYDANTNENVHCFEFCKRRSGAGASL